MLDNFVVELRALSEPHKVIFFWTGKDKLTKRISRMTVLMEWLNGIKRLTRVFHFAQFTLVVCQLCKKESWVGKF